MHTHMHPSFPHLQTCLHPCLRPQVDDVLRVMHCSFECVLGAIQLSNGFEDCS